ncbi:uncharacterized protein LOC128242753 isoform X2 [Mya arenaria]|uniref:uncharacterized protein LOC128242753 isoform X2 n=1 Tax=Mya arenaria TaxID=6604 RepID=UPI0022E8A598|nr:uncharacterized protein LOC128242753 isoform X2 [Mya arenaria]
MSRQECGGGDFHGNREVNQKPRPLRSNAMPDREIKKFSQNIGKDFHQLALFLNFEQRQYDMLVRSFQGISEQTFRLVKAWHDVVVDCDENPKELLASALLDIGNKYLAVTYFDEQFANDAEGKEPKQETIEKIQEIDFGAVVNYGASASGSNDVPDSSAGTSGLFKKRDDDTMTQTMVDCFASHMKSVAALIIGGQVVGTAFRVGGMFLMTAFHVVRAIVVKPFC